MKFQTVNEKISHLQSIMQKNQVDILIVPTADPHLSEYLPEYWQVRSWLSGFTGSAGTLLIHKEKAILWADSRYWEQARQQLSGSIIELGKMLQANDVLDWIIQNTEKNQVVAVADDMIALSQYQHYQNVLSRHDIVFNAISDLVDEMWHDRPALPMAPIYPHLAQFVFESSLDKINRIREKMKAVNADYHLVSSLDDVAWISNLRGSDVSSNPVFLAHLLIGLDSCIIFLHKNKLNDESIELLKQAHIQIRDYADLDDELAQLTGVLWVDSGKMAVRTLAKLPENVILYEASNPSSLFKSQKNPQEIQCIRNAMVKDGVALCGFFADLEQRFANQQRVSENDIDGMLIHYRSLQAHYVSPSFDTIAAFNGNGAMPHYRAPEQGSSWIEGDGLLLIDSGAQYQDGTTDITRVMPVGNVNIQQKQDFTVVLKAHIALATTVFPENMPAPMIDAIARKPMWLRQCEYGHGTGHGVGYFMNVHEGPQRIAYQSAVNADNVLKLGMITSNEPGLYRQGRWGIRIENLVVNQKVESPLETEFGSFLYFETLTLCPIDTRLIDVALLNDEEISWVNQYHQMVRDKLSPLVEGDALAWLLARTEAIAP
ncbi:aminopeptidase P family protein [Alysiella filiformis]|uniref:Xaa-Pro aminopeptidase n=1 Tax=Alysiella filiformis DSM 16848 TaxID=1120981 RepID=A0A286ERW4_9NEIS|nr:aminopeptidase P family protein [Alysiella filiformis]QMT32419.1 aminopeptidase P family protein [Alysiella filiformis]UBQ57341.1 aminopeptidase P family protein [Alysiella filiformis DSM 16848]SOD73646.1 Xaa-Pro aminopeptidase [Alysiella filiformis DSM 16848]